jgi:hypothetical protein
MSCIYNISRDIYKQTITKMFLNIHLTLLQCHFFKGGFAYMRNRVATALMAAKIEKAIL